MERIEQHILVDAPVSVVFGFVNEPFNLLRILPGVIEVTSGTRLANGGRNFQCTAKMAGVRILYAAECIEHRVNQQISYKISGGLHGAMHWHFEQDKEQTQVIFVLEYEVPIPLLKRHPLSEISRQNQQVVQQLLHNLKSMLERRAQGVQGSE